MWELVLLALVAWGISVLSKAARATRQRADGWERADRMQGGAADAPRPSLPKPARPVDTDLPRQTAMPIHRDEPAEGESGVEGWTDPRRTTTSLYYDRMENTIQPSERVRAEEAQHRKAEREAQAVNVPGLDLRMDADSLVKGVIFSEILGRRRHHQPLCRRTP